MGTYLAMPEQTINFHQGSNRQIEFISGEMQGWRMRMEDTSINQLDIGDGNSLFGVFDGHGGSEVSRFASETIQRNLKSSAYYANKDYPSALQEAFRKIDDELLHYEGNLKLKQLRNKSQEYVQTELQSYNIGNASGCTANVILITPEEIFVANVGDSRSILCSNGKAIQLSTDHKPDIPDELRRIQAAGGEVSYGRVNGMLTISRCLGSLEFKNNENLPYDQQLVICKPDIKKVSKSKEHQFIIMGSDGIWEKWNNNQQELIKIVKTKLAEKQQQRQIINEVLHLSLAESTQQGTGCDNITAIIIRFKQ